MLAFVTAPVGIAAYHLVSRELATALRSLGALTVLGESSAAQVDAFVAYGFTPTDAMGEVVDARAATIGQCDLLVAVLDGAHPDVLVDIGLAYAQGTDCYGLQLNGEPLEGLHAMMLDGHATTIPDLIAHLRPRLRGNTGPGSRQPIVAGERPPQ